MRIPTTERMLSIGRFVEQPSDPTAVYFYAQSIPGLSPPATADKTPGLYRFGLRDEKWVLLSARTI